MTDLKMMALDQEDLSIVSAHVQDSVFKAGDVSWSPRDGQLSITVNRFVWEGVKRKSRSFERRRAVLVFKRVSSARSQGIDPRKKDEVLALLALRFTPEGEGPEGRIELMLAGDATMALDVECIEVQLADVGGAWETTSRPDHPNAP